jgi:hypothetical protein
MKKPKKLMNFRADAELAQIIESEAKRVKRPVSSFIRAILEMVLLSDPDETEAAK